MNSFFNFQVGTFAETGPGWFDWLSLIVTSLMSVIGILAAYFIAKGAFKEEQKLKAQNDKKLIDIEMMVFKERLLKLHGAIDEQIKKLEQNKDVFILEVESAINIDFLQSTDLTKIYQKIGTSQSAEISNLSNLIVNLSSLSNLPSSLREEGRRFSEKYNFHEEKFYLYRKLMYTHFYSLYNYRQPMMGDFFMQEYKYLLDKTLMNHSIIKNGVLVSRELLVEEFVIKLISISNKYVLRDGGAINTSDLANEVLSAYYDMEEVKRIFKETIESYIIGLKKVKWSMDQTRLLKEFINSSSI